MLEKQESLRNVADDSGVSQETIRHVVRAARCGYKASLRTDLPRSQHSIVLDAAGRNIEFDSRPSDAFALALRAKSPLFAEEWIMEQSGYTQ